MHILLANCTKMLNDGGGMSKVACSFANEFVRRGHVVTIMHCDEKPGKYMYYIDSSVSMCNLNVAPDGRVVRYPLWLKAIREILRPMFLRQARSCNDWFYFKFLSKNLKYHLDMNDEYDVIISFGPQVTLFFQENKVSIPIVTMSHGDPEDYFVTYPVKQIEAVRLTTINQVLLKSFEKHITDHLPEARVVTIGNAVPQSSVVDLKESKKTNNIIFIGELNKNRKRPHLLVEAFSRIVQRFPNWNVEIWGARDTKIYYRELLQLIKRKGLQDKVFLRGFSKAICQEIEKAAIYVTTSSNEGFGLSLAEAMSAGLPAIGYKSCVAVNELIQDGYNGFLVDDGVEPVAQAMEKLMQDKNLRVTMGQHAHESMKKYAPEKIWDQWEKLLEDVAND